MHKSYEINTKLGTQRGGRPPKFCVYFITVAHILYNVATCLHLFRIFRAIASGTVSGLATCKARNCPGGNCVKDAKKKQKSCKVV